MGDMYSELLVELECPICTNYMSPPIRQCATGHSICEGCRKKLEACALCQGQFTESRNISLEGLAIKMKYPCINKDSGCLASLAFNEREVHELKCQYKGFKCPMDKCTWIGKYEDITSHWASKKMTSKPYHASNVCHTKLKAGSYYVNVVEAHDQLFWYKCKIINKKLYWALQLVGKASEAENYYYEIEIFKPGQNKRKMILSDYCQSVDIENSDLIKEGSCISIYADMVEPFLNDEQVLVYFMRVNAIKMNPKKEQAEAAAKTQKIKEKTQKEKSKGPQNQNHGADAKQKKGFNPQKK